MNKIKLVQNENKAICAPCGGKCCKRAPGLMSPEDAGLPEDKEKFKQMVRSGLYTFDYWEGGSKISFP